MYENYEKYDMLKCFLLSDENAELAKNLYMNQYPERRQPFSTTFQRLKNNLINYGSFTKSRPKSYQSRRDWELEEVTVLGEIENNPQLSTRKLEDQTGINRNSVRRILKKHKLKAFRTRKVHRLYPRDFEYRLTFCRWFLNKYEEDENFPLNCIWTDEASVSSAGIFNRYNSYTWARQNPHTTVEIVNQGRYSFNVWVGVFNGIFIGPYIFEGTLNSQKYLEILQQHVEPFMDNLPLNQRGLVFFQQDGAPAHNARIITEFLNREFGNNWLANQGPLHWPARSPDLAPLDFFVWGKIKDITFRQRPQTKDELQAALLQAFNSIPNIELINAVRRSLPLRCRRCLQENGRQFEHL